MGLNGKTLWQPWWAIWEAAYGPVSAWPLQSSVDAFKAKIENLVGPMDGDSPKWGPPPYGSRAWQEQQQWIEKAKEAARKLEGGEK